MEMQHARTYTEGSSTCPIEFHARKVLLEQVEGRVSRLLSQFDIKEGTLEISMLKEVYEPILLSMMGRPPHLRLLWHWQRLFAPWELPHMPQGIL